jgi:hypothetical protein
LALCLTKETKTTKIKEMMISVCSSTLRGTTPTYPKMSPTRKSRGSKTITKECEKHDEVLLLSSWSIKIPIL